MHGAVGQARQLVVVPGHIVESLRNVRSPLQDDLLGQEYVLIHVTSQEDRGYCILYCMSMILYFLLRKKVFLMINQ